MEETAVEKRGISERLLKELLKSQRFKNDLKLLASSVDPAAAGGLVRTLLWEDIEVFMGTTSALPSLLNYAAHATRELAAQLNTLPPPMLVAFLTQLVGQVDFPAVEAAMAELKALLERAQPVLESLRDASAGAREGLEALRESGGAGGEAAKKTAAESEAARAKKPAAAKKAGADKRGAAE